MNWLIENWYVLVGLIALIIAIVYVAVNFFRMPTSKQIEALKEWLKYAVAMAEKELGSGTGQLKLRRVYDMAIVKFPWVATMYSFDEFSKNVDDALIWLEKQLDANKAVKTIVNGGVENGN